MPRSPTVTQRFVHLECARGITAIIVMFHHFCLGFYPGIKANISQGWLRWTPLYMLVPGDGAVMFFFILSGFVLTHGMFKRPSWKWVVKAIIKRLPRLMVPAGVSIIIGYWILKYYSGAHLSAAALSHSDWLRTFASAPFPPDLTPSFSDALRQCLLVFIHGRNSYYNSNLWTMAYEFRGSLLVFFISSLFCFSRMRHPFMMAGVHILLLGILVAQKNILLIGFVLGSLIAFVNTKIWPEAKIPSLILRFLLFFGILGFSVNSRAITTITSLLLMVVLVYDPSIKTLMSGRAAAFLGKISFPIYLVSTLVILSFSSNVFVWLTQNAVVGAERGLIVLMVTLVLSLLLSLPLLLIDMVWLQYLNRIVALAIGTIFSETRRVRNYTSKNSLTQFDSSHSLKELD